MLPGGVESLFRRRQAGEVTLLDDHGGEHGLSGDAPLGAALDQHPVEGVLLIAHHLGEVGGLGFGVAPDAIVAAGEGIGRLLHSLGD